MIEASMVETTKLRQQRALSVTIPFDLSGIVHKT
jgi:hypothetical protein